MNILDKIKKYSGLLAISFIGFHFLMVFFYVAPIDVVGNKLSRYSGFYIKPVFNQQWSLFAPAPVEEHSIFYKNNEMEKWIDLVETDHNQADLFFITPHWRFSIGSYNLLYWVGSDLKYFEKSNGGVPEIIKEKYWKRYFSNALLKTFTRSFLKRNGIKYKDNVVHEVKCEFKHLQKNTTKTVTFVYENL